MPGPRSSSSASGGTSRSRGRRARRAASRRASGAARRRTPPRGQERSRGGSPTQERAPRRRDGPRADPPPPRRRPCRTPRSRETAIIRRAFALIEDAAGDATRRARHAPAGRRARNTERARPLARSLRARAHARRSSVARASGPGASRACHRPVDTISDRCARGRSDPADRTPTPIFASELSRPVRHVGLSPTRWRHSTSRADPNPRDVPPDAEPPPLDDASRRARAPSRRAPHRLGQSQAAQEQRGPIDRPRRDGDRDRDSVCVLPRVHRRRRRRPRRVHSRHRRRRTPPRRHSLGGPRLVLRHHLLDARHRRHRARGDALRPRRAPVRHLRLDRRPPTRRRPSPPFGPEDIASHFAVAVAAAAAVTAARAALLRAWPDFARAADRSNRQVLTPLNRGDVVTVSFLPAVAEEALFAVRSYPRSGADPWASRRRGGVRGVTRGRRAQLGLCRLGRGGGVSLRCGGCADRGRRGGHAGARIGQLRQRGDVAGGG